MLLFLKLQCLFCTIITICTLNMIITLFLHNWCSDHAQFFLYMLQPSSYLQPLLYFVFKYNQLFFWMQIKTKCYYCYYYYFSSLQHLGLFIKQVLLLLKKLWIVDWHLCAIILVFNLQITSI